MMISFANSDCLGNELTYNKPCNFDAKITNNTNIQFNNNTYICLGRKEQITDVTSIQFNTLDTNLSTPTTGKWHIISNVISNGDYRIKRITYNYDTSKLEILINDVLYSYDYAMPTGTAIPFSFALSSNGQPVVRINNTNLTGATTSDSTETGDNYGYINAYRESTDSTIQISNISWKVLWSIVFYKDSDTTHAYRLCEGIGNYIYDSIGNLHGVLVSSNINVARIFEAGKYPFNLNNGFTMDEEPAIAITTARAPSNKQLIIYKSDWHEGNESNDANKWVVAGTALAINEDGIIIKNNYKNDDGSVKPAATIALTKTGFNFTPQQFGRSFKLKAKLKNIHTTKLTSFVVTIGTNYSDTRKNGLAGATKIFDTALNQNDSADIDLEIPACTTKSVEGFLRIICIRVIYESDIPGGDDCAILSDLELIQTNHLKTYYKSNSINGLTYVESKLDFTNGVNNLAEFNTSNLPNLNIYPILWYKDNIYNSNRQGISTELGPNTNDLTKLGSITAYNNSNILGITLDATNTLTKSILHIVPQTGFALQKEFCKGKWHFKCKIHNFYNTAWNNQQFIISIGNGILPIRNSSNDITGYNDNTSKALASKTITLNTVPSGFELSGNNMNITTDNSETIEFDLDPNDIANVSLTQSYLLFISTVDGFLTNTADTRRWGISDIELTYTPDITTYEPIYFKRTGNNISNILVYKTPQKGINLERIKAHLK